MGQFVYKYINCNIKNTDIPSLLLIISASAVVSYSYIFLVDIPHYDSRLTLHNQILEGSAQSPFAYRLLVPFTVEFIISVFQTGLSEKNSFILAYSLFDFIAISFSLVALFFWTRLWFSKEKALIGVLFVATTIGIGLRDHYFQPWSLLEPGFFSLALLFIFYQRHYSLVVLVAVTTLNRETGIFIPLMYICYFININELFKKQKSLDFHKVKIFIFLVITWFITYFTIRYFVGERTHIIELLSLFERNIEFKGLAKTFLNITLFFGVFWIYIVLGFSQAPKIIKNISLVIPFYLLVISIFGVWYEVRVLFTLYPILLPLGLSFIFPPMNSLTNKSNQRTY
jgi:hypothetical protein